MEMQPSTIDAVRRVLGWNGYDLDDKFQWEGITFEYLYNFIEFIKTTSPNSEMTKKLIFISGLIHSGIYEWHLFYQKFFNLYLDFSNVIIPKCPSDKWQLLVVAKGISLEEVYQKHQAIYGRGRKWTDAILDEIVVSSRSNNDSYAIWVSNNQESDNNLKNFPANFIISSGLTTETLLERLLHELNFFRETGKHLDMIGSTLCTGSKWNDLVPSVNWRQDGGTHINWHSLSRSTKAMGARRVIV